MKTISYDCSASCETMKKLIYYALDNPGKTKIKVGQNPNSILIFTSNNLNLKLAKSNSEEFQECVNHHLSTIKISTQKDLNALDYIKKNIETLALDSEKVIQLLKNLQICDLFSYIEKQPLDLEKFQWTQYKGYKSKDMTEAFLKQFNLLAENGAHKLSTSFEEFFLQNHLFFNKLYEEKPLIFTQSIRRFLSLVYWRKIPQEKFIYSKNPIRFFNEHNNIVSLDYVIEDNRDNVGTMFKTFNMNFMNLNAHSVSAIFEYMSHIIANLRHSCGNNSKNFKMYEKKELALSLRQCFTSLLYMKKDQVDCLNREAIDNILNIYQYYVDNCDNGSVFVSSLLPIIEKLKIQCLIEKNNLTSTPVLKL